MENKDRVYLVTRDELKEEVKKATKNVDADKVDGLHADDLATKTHNHDGRYLKPDERAADSQLLGGKPASQFASKSHNHDGEYLKPGQSNDHNHDDTYLKLNATAVNSEKLGNQYTKEDITNLVTQNNTQISDENGSHGLRVYNNRMQYLINGNWVNINNHRVMTAVIDLSNSNPNTCISYEDDAKDMIPGSPEWDDFFGHYPLLFKNGQEVGKLQRNNFDKFENGTVADITSGNAGDAMIAFPRRGLKINTIGNKIYISMTDDPENPDFEYNAHTRGTDGKDKFYFSVYQGYELDSKLRSLKGKTPTTSKTIAAYRTLAQANGKGYEATAFYQLTFRQCMFILKYKSLDSQSTIGYGYVLSSHTAPIPTGGTETWGMDCELIKVTNPSYMTDQDHHVKFLGIEDHWGNIWNWLEGMCSDASRNVLTGNDNFNDTGVGYVNNGNGGVTANISGYMSKPQGATKSGFVGKEISGSTTTYFCDWINLCPSCIAACGGSWASSANAGLFRLNVSDAASATFADVASRLMYL